MLITATTFNTPSATGLSTRLQISPRQFRPLELLHLANCALPVARLKRLVISPSVALPITPDRTGALQPFAASPRYRPPLCILPCTLRALLEMPSIETQHIILISDFWPTAQRLLS